MIAVTESNRAQLKQFHFIQLALLTYKKLTHKGECYNKEKILQKKSHAFLFIRILLTLFDMGFF